MSQLEFLVGSAVLLLPRGNFVLLAGAAAVKGAGGHPAHAGLGLQT